MKTKTINSLKQRGFEFIRHNSAKNIVIMAVANKYKEEVEVFFDSVIQSEIERPHYFGKRIDITGDTNDCVAAIYLCNDQEETLVKKYHLHKSESPEKFRQKVRMMVSRYNLL